jgi:hypothetical protein
VGRQHTRSLSDARMEAVDTLGYATPAHQLHQP